MKFCKTLFTPDINLTTHGAVLAFVAAVGAELATGKTIMEQFALAPGPIIGFSALFAIATLIVSSLALSTVALVFVITFSYLTITHEFIRRNPVLFMLLVVQVVLLILI